MRLERFSKGLRVKTFTESTSYPEQVAQDLVLLHFDYLYSFVGQPVPMCGFFHLRKRNCVNNI